jgi:hypothetical protein
MAVALNASGLMTGGNGAGGASQQVSTNTTISSTGLTIAAGTDRFLVGLLVWSSGTAPTGVTMTWNGVSMTQAGTVQFSTNTSGALFYLDDPATGNNTLSASWTNSQDCVMSAACFDGVGSYVSGDTVQNSTNTVTITAAAGDATVSVYNCDGGTPVGDKTAIFANSALGPSAAGNYNLGSTSTHTYEIGSSSARVTVGLHLQAAGSGTRPLFRPA